MSTFGLNYIVGPGDAGALKRSLDSYKAKELFDEIVIAPTCNDQHIIEVAKEYGAKIFMAPWADKEYPHGNFGRARNVALKNSTSDYIMWLDCDDVCMDKNQKSLENLVKTVKDDKNNHIDVYFVQYAVVSDDNWRPVVSFLRERVFKRDERFEWKYPVHEQFLPERSKLNTAEFNGFYNTHMPDKPNVASAERNVRISQAEYDKGNITPHLKYFMARDILLLGRDREALKLYTELIDGLELHKEHIYASCLDLLNWYAYQGVRGRPEPEDLTISNEKEIETWCRMAIEFSDGYAEPFVILGDLFLRRGDDNKAAKMYSIALTKKYGRSGMQTVTYYEEIPCKRMADILYKKGDKERALFHNRRALNCHLDNDLLEKRKEIITSLVDEFKKFTSTT